MTREEFYIEYKEMKGFCIGLTVAFILQICARAWDPVTGFFINCYAYWCLGRWLRLFPLIRREVEIQKWEERND